MPEDVRLLRHERSGAGKVRASSFRETIPPVPAGVPRPLWSVMIPTYNCAHHLRETLASVLMQDPGPHIMQIEVVDDCSTMDDPESIVAELGKGRVAFHRRPENGGHRANFRSCLERSRGHLIHLLHGDDAIRDGFYHKLQRGFEISPRIGAAFSRHIFMDERGHWLSLSDLERKESGVLEDWLARIALRQRIQTPSIVVRREIYETLGIFDRRLSWVEDWEMWVRISAVRPVWYEVEPLALYRMHTQSNSSRHTRTGENLQDVRRAVRMIREYLPPHTANRTGRLSLRFWAIDTLLNRVPGILAQGDLRTASVQIIEALRCSSSPRVLAMLLPLLPRMGLLAARVAVRRIGRRIRLQR